MSNKWFYELNELDQLGTDAFVPVEFEKLNRSKNGTQVRVKVHWQMHEQTRMLFATNKTGLTFGLNCL